MAMVSLGVCTSTKLALASTSTRIRIRDNTILCYVIIICITTKTGLRTTHNQKEKKNMLPRRLPGSGLVFIKAKYSKLEIRGQSPFYLGEHGRHKRGETVAPRR
jgi:hypothetical protein